MANNPPPQPSQVDVSLHVKVPPIDSSTASLMVQFRAELEAEPVYRDNPYCRDYVSDTCLHAYLRARNNDLKKAKKLLLGTLEWRLTARPDFIPPSAIEGEQKTGKMVQRHHDRHGRPIWVMDSSKDNGARSHDDAIAQLFYHLEHARRQMREGVEKYCLFIHLENYGSSTSPPMKTSMETLKTLTERYPEHLGHAVLYQPPFLFSLFWKAVKPFLDSKTVSKIIFLRGKCDPGTDNDKILCDIIGEDWRVKCEVDTKPEENYVHQRDFPLLLEEFQQHKISLEKYQNNQEKKEEEKSTENDKEKPAGEEKPVA